MSLVVAFLHAYGDRASSLEPAADRLRRSVGRRIGRTVFLEGDRKAGRKGRAWTSYESKGPREVASAADRVARLLAPLKTRLTRLALFGFSQGAMLALEVAFRTELPVLAVVGVGTFLAPGGLARDRSRVLAGKNRPKILLLHGRDDEDVPPSEAERALARVSELGADAQLQFFPRTGHEVTKAMLARTARFLRELR